MESYIVYPTKEQESAIEAFFEAFDVSFDKKSNERLPDHVLKGIAEGEADLDAGRTISIEEFRKNFRTIK